MGYLVPEDITRYHKGEDNHQFATMEKRIKKTPWGGTWKIQIMGHEDTLGAVKGLLTMTDRP